MPDPETWAALGRALRREATAGGGPLVDVTAGARRPATSVRDSLGEVLFEALVREGLLELTAVGASGAEVAAGVRLLASPDFVVAAPDTGHRPDLVYVGPDTSLLVEAALRLAPSGERAVDLGTGAGLVAAALSRRYRCVVATDIVQRATEVAGWTMMLNARPPGHVWLTVEADVTGGLRRGSFDLVVANTPWVPASADPNAPARVFADGGRDGIELPARFLVEGASLLRPGGLAVMLALHSVRADGRRPLLELCGMLEHDGFTAAVIPTTLNTTYAELSPKVLARCPDLVEAVHVAVVVGAPPAEGGRRESLVVACDALARRWGTTRLGLGVMA